MGCTSSKQAQAEEPVAGPHSAAAPAREAQPSLEAAKGSEEAIPDTTRLGYRPPEEPSNELRETTEKPLIIFVIGGPGSGKGTQCAKIVEKYGKGFRHLSTGDLLRAEVKKGSDLGKQLEATMKSGGLVSDDQVIALLEKEVSDSAWFGTAFLVDGFPRAVSQAEQFERRVRPADMVLYFECPEDVMIERLTGRGKSSGRQDDNPETVKERLQTFQRQSLPVVEFYRRKGCLHSISAVGAADEIFQKVVPVLDKKLGREGDEGVVATEVTAIPEWRTPAVVDIENRFYGSLKDQPESQTA